ncbi:ABC transporter permease [Pseudoblastomonas halimionae]|uniref:FtsX-like permease family protein n=1 Tax=Alteriqipengyuania halimionae TaxID=1926630 RepID=A0A6I4U5C9_9SPHN|nr:FtsX-like permease family protein [Alteriqipengyuania halimionae]MXP10083.1 FtsX-like permease family protein [Alteriqipengyuania halimionae]
MNWSTAWRIARRELNARFRGLRLLLVCLFLGVGALAAIYSLTGAIEGELETRGREILGGDVQAEVWQRAPTDEELAAFEELGDVSVGLRMQATARHGDLVSPIELKSVDEAYPLVGTLTLEDGRAVGPPAADEAWLSRGAADRLDLKPGNSFAIGGRDVRVGGIIASEPDRLGEGFSLGPAVLVRAGFPEAAGLAAPGAFYQSKTRIAFDTPRDLDETVEALEERFPTAGYDFDTAERASPGAERFVSRMGQFLVLVGLAALVIAGIGIGGGVSSYLEARRQSIATLKVLGATSGDVAKIYLLQILAAALVGSVLGLVAGVALTPLIGKALEGLLPVAAGVTLDTRALIVAPLFGLLVALIFAAPPLARARSFPAMALMRARATPIARDRRAWLPVLIGLALLLALVLATASQKMLSLIFLGGAAAMLGLLALLGWAIRKLAARVPRPSQPIARIALANLHRPGAQTGALVTALGFGLSAFVLLAAIQTSIAGNIQLSVPERAPDYFVLDVPRDRADDFRALVEETAPGSVVRTVPALRGRILAYGPEDDEVRVDELEELPEGAWPLRGERGLTYADAVPEGNTITEGQWWGPMWQGDPLVSVDAELGDVLGLRIGDTITIGVLGVERTARIANFRRIDWEALGFNYVLVFSPNTLEDAPHNLAATIETPDGATAALLQALVRQFPSSSAIEVGGILKQARDLLEQVGIAILAAASVAVLAGLAVLVGAIAAARASRLYDNVVLRVLGASRRQLLLLQLAEYALLATLLSGVALAIGSGLAWLVVTQLFEFDWLPHWPTVLAVLSGGVATVLVVAIGGSLPLLRAKPAQALRTL